MRATPRVLGVVLGVLFAPAAQAADGYSFDAGLGTVVPLYVGGQFVAELPHRILLSAEAGWMPGPYVDAVNATAQAFGAYNDVTADVVRSAISNSLVLRPSIGWRPFADHGFEVMAGYTLVMLGGSLSAIEAIEAATGQAVSAQGSSDIAIASVMHAFHVTAGWSWALAEHWSLRASLGYLQVVASSTSMEVASSRVANRQGVAALERELDSYLNDVFTTYVKIPTLGLTLNYRF